MSQNPYFGLLLFDLDGTLIDSEGLVAESVRNVAKKRGLAIPSRSRILRVFYGTPSPPRLLSHFGMINRTDSHEYWKFYRENLRSLSLKDSNLISHLEQIRQGGVRIGLVTSLSRDVARMVLKHFDLDKYLESSKFYERGVTKSMAIVTVTQELGEDVRRTLYIGDSPSDIISAKRAGCWSGAVAWDNAKDTDCIRQEPDFIFADFCSIVRRALAEGKPTR